MKPTRSTDKPRSTAKRGAAALEFGLLLPVFTATFVGIMDYGWLFYHIAGLDSAANVGCRAGSLIDPGMGEADMALVQERAAEATAAALAKLGIPCDGRCRTSATPFGDNPSRSIRCSVDYDFEPLVGAFIDPSVMESLQVSRLEYQR